MAIPASDFEFYKQFLTEETGLSPESEKIYLLESRLSPVYKKMGFEDLGELTDLLRAGDANAKRCVIEAILDTETCFFRDRKTFDMIINDLLPDIVASKKRKETISIWAVGCASGQEPYSLAMLIKEQAKMFKKNIVKIFATDLSESAIKTAIAGEYTQYDVQRGVPVRMLIKYFAQNNTDWMINKNVRSLVKFEVGNILNSVSVNQKYDLVLCRNVLSEFDESQKRKALENIHASLARHGRLVIGFHDNIEGAKDLFVPQADKDGLYIPVQPA